MISIKLQQLLFMIHFFKFFIEILLFRRSLKIRIKLKGTKKDPFGSRDLLLHFYNPKLLS
jgi:hypothetical protein